MSVTFTIHKALFCIPSQEWLVFDSNYRTSRRLIRWGSTPYWVTRCYFFFIPTSSSEDLNITMYDYLQFVLHNQGWQWQPREGHHVIFFIVEDISGSFLIILTSRNFPQPLANIRHYVIFISFEENGNNFWCISNIKKV